MHQQVLTFTCQVLAVRVESAINHTVMRTSAGPARLTIAFGKAIYLFYSSVHPS